MGRYYPNVVRSSIAIRLTPDSLFPIDCGQTNLIESSESTPVLLTKGDPQLHWTLFMQSYRNFMQREWICGSVSVPAATGVRPVVLTHAQ
jgi:hypothetical protein